MILYQFLLLIAIYIYGALRIQACCSMPSQGLSNSNLDLGLKSDLITWITVCAGQLGQTWIIKVRTGFGINCTIRIIAPFGAHFVS